MGLNEAPSAGPAAATLDGWERRRRTWSGTWLVLFLLFFASGFCSLLYQVVWLRMAFAAFGIITPVLSVMLSVFMLGLAVGAYVGGRLAERLVRWLGISPSWFYGGAELVVVVGAFTVPVLFSWGERLLLAAGATSSGTYLLLSALVITASLLPWCIMMGATFPLMLAFVRRLGGSSGFSFLYLANVIGAMTGTLASALVLIELFGLAATWRIAAAGNFAIAAVSFALAAWQPAPIAEPVGPRRAGSAIVPVVERGRWMELVLFATGFCSLAMEVVWTRAFTYVLQTTIYAFAAVLATYLLATWIGSAAYRFMLARGRPIPSEWLLGWLAVFVFLPVVIDDPNVQERWRYVLASIFPFCATLGYLTPKLVDEYSGGRADLAGRCYGINIFGGILGPLFAGYVLLPFVDVRIALLVLALPIVVLALAAMRSARQWVLAVPAAALLLYAGLLSRSYEEGAYLDGPREVHRDHVATAIAHGQGKGMGLLVNGVGITHITPITKIMAHLPLALHGHAQSGLVICFGMGTTFRAMHSWGIETTAVDLTGAVVDSFGFFFADAAKTVADRRAHIVVDDGRRYLLRTTDKYDVIAIDPPPPVEAAGSRLLYSSQFYTVVKQHLKPDGILQQWLPGGEATVVAAVTRSLTSEFPYVAAFRSIEGWGTHFLASMTPIPSLSAAEFAARMPPTAQRDLLEWSDGLTAEAMAAKILGARLAPEEVAPASGAAIEITDDHPYNEYFILRRELPERWRLWPSVQTSGASAFKP
jgi:predicted membrane-bound spermidine synthase